MKDITIKKATRFLKDQGFYAEISEIDLTANEIRMTLSVDEDIGGPTAWSKIRKFVDAMLTDDCE